MFNQRVFGTREFYEYACKYIPANGDYTLVIVDMQPQFRTSTNNSTLSAVEAEIHQAIRLNNGIVILEYGGFGPTNPRLTGLVSNYGRCRTMTKHGDDGSEEVLEACRSKAFTSLRLRVCGVNTRACVLYTVRGLATELSHSTVEVVTEACNDVLDNDFSKFPQQRNVLLTNAT